MSEYAMWVDWSDESSFDRWENVGQQVMREFYEKHPKEAEKDGHDIENGEIKYLDEVLDGWSPMMNYAYPLETTPDDEKIIKVCRETCLTVMKDTKDYDDKLYLALCGGGMDLSQSIARAYQILETLIPVSLLTGVCTQPELSVHGNNWLKLARQIRKQEEMEISRLQRSRKTWAGEIKKFNKTRKESKLAESI
jgi:hypothetical protein